MKKLKELKSLLEKINPGYDIPADWKITPENIDDYIMYVKEVFHI